MVDLAKCDAVRDNWLAFFFFIRNDMRCLN